jgi:iron complex outermembrane recepter protein
MLCSPNRRGSSAFATRPSAVAAAVAALSLPYPWPGAAQAQAVTAPAASVAEPERVFITGSSIKRVDAEGALPVTTITREEIDKIGAVTAADLLRRLPQSGNLGFTQAGTAGSLTPGAESIALRDLSANATLVLLNGRRLPTYPLSSASASFVNLAQIPAAAIARVEVLKDGASSIYGSDAVAGVINFITRKNYQGVETTLRYGDAQRGHPREVAISLSGGFGNLATDRYNALFTVEHLDRTMLRQNERDYAATNDTRDRGGYDRRNFYSEPANAQSLTGTLFAARGCPASQLKGGLCYNDFSQYGTLVPFSRRTNLTSLITFNAAPSVEVFGELLAGQEESKSIRSPDILTGRFVTQATARGNPFGVDVRALGLIPGTPLREEFVKSESARAMVGARGTHAGLDWEAALAHGRGKTTSSFTGQLITAATSAALANGDVSPFGIVANDPVRVAALLTSNDRNSIVDTTDADGRVAWSLWQLPAGPVEAAAGLSWRRESLDDKTDAKVSTLANGVDYGRRDGSRDTSSAYVEVVVPVLRTLELQLSARHDEYSDFGGTTNPKAAVRWKLLPDLAFRASASSGFRAPSLSQIVQGNTTAFANAIVDPRRCPVTAAPSDCGSGSVNVQIGGNKDLQPETSRSTSVGLVFQIGRSFEIALDRYEIDYRDQINTPIAAAVLRNELVSTGSLVVRRPPTAADVAAGIPGAIELIRTVPANLARSKVAGWDVEFKVRAAAGAYGSLVWTGAATYVERLLEQVETSRPLIDAIGTYTKPRTRATSALDWTLGNCSARLGARYTGGYDDGAPSTTGSRETFKVAGYTQVDAQLGWKAWPGGALTLGVSNLADKRSPYSNAAASGNAPHGDLIGRAFYVAVRHAWR